MIERDGRSRPVNTPSERWAPSPAWRAEMGRRERQARVDRAYQATGRRCGCDGSWLRYRPVRCRRCPLRGVINSPADVP